MYLKKIACPVIWSNREFQLQCNIHHSNWIIFSYLGEISSGQTSFINLLLNTDVLPVDETGCTKTCCLLKTGSKPQATLHMRNQTNKESIVRILDLESDVDKYALQKFITSSISEDGSIIQERVDIEFPFTFLEVYYESLMYSRTCK